MAITFTPGEVISWDDLNALMAQHGSPGGAKSVVKLTLTKEERERLEDDGLDPENHGRYRYYFADGSYVDAETQTPAPGETNAQGAATGTFRVVEYKPSQAYQQQARAQSPETQSPAAQRTAREETEIARNAALPPGQDPYPETDRERRERADRVIKEQGAAAQAAEDRKSVV